MVLPPTQELGGMDPISNRDNLNATGNLLKQKPFGENRQSVGALSASQSQQQERERLK